MKRFTSFMLMLLCAVTTWAQSYLRISDGLLATQENGQYKWTSAKMTLANGDTKLRITFLETSNNEKPAGFPCVAIAEFYLYDKDGVAVTLTEANFSSNATQSDEGSIAELCDGATTQQDGEGVNDWYWHSQWSGTPSPYGYHYLEVDLADVDADLSEYSIGWVTRRSQASPKDIVVSTGASTDAAAMNYKNAMLPELTTNAEAPVYYAIRNVRGGTYVTYSRDNAQMILNTAISNASIFYFTGSIENGIETAKIHNYVATGCLADFSSWTAEGKDWYIQESGNTQKPGYAISKENNLTENAHSWNNAGNTNTKIANWAGNDIGSTFEFIKLSAEEVQNIANGFISGPEKLVSGKSYNFRNLSALNFLAGGDETLGTNGDRAANTTFAYYVSPYTGAKYLYNVSAQKFIGTTSEANAAIPLTATPVSKELTFKKGNHPSFPIMISTNNGGGAVNHSGWYGRIINWQGGFWDTSSSDNSFCVEEVSVVDENVLATIEDLVGTYELPIWQERTLAHLGCVGGYAFDLRDEIETIEDYAGRVAFETEHSKIGFTAGYYYVQHTDTKKYATYNGENFVAEELAEGVEPGLRHLMQFVQEGEHMKLRVANVGKYVTLSDAPAVSKISQTEFNNGHAFTIEDKGGAKIIIKNGNGSVMRTENNGDINYWSGDVNTTWYLMPVSEVEVSVNEYASIYLPFAATITGATAYAIEATNSTHAVLTEKTDIAANEGAILAGNGVATLTIVAESKSDWSKNMLEGTTVDSYIAGDAYVLSNGNNGIGLYGVMLNKDAGGNDGETHFKNNANKAYLPISVATPAAYYSFRFGENTTAIENVEVENASNVIYDLTGRRVEAITAPGIYIVGGKKVLVK